MIDLRLARDLYARPSPGVLMRTVALLEPGLYRLARRTCELYCVQIVGSGAWGRAQMLTGAGRPVWEQPSTFTGSFVLGGECEDGLIANLHCLKPSDAINFTISWREPDREVV